MLFGERRGKEGKEGKGAGITYSISAFHCSDKDSRVAGVDAEGFVEEVVEVFDCFCI